MGQDIVQDIQNVFWSAGDILSSMIGEHTVIKSDDNKRSKIKEHFDKVSNELTTIKTELNNKASDTNTTAKVNNVIDKIITAVTKIAGAIEPNMNIGEIKNDNTKKASMISNKQSVQAIINGVKEIVNIAESSGVKIEKNDDDNTPISASSNSDAPAALNGAVVIIMLGWGYSRSWLCTS